MRIRIQHFRLIRIQIQVFYDKKINIFGPTMNDVQAKGEASGPLKRTSGTWKQDFLTFPCFMVFFATMIRNRI